MSTVEVRTAIRRDALQERQRELSLRWLERLVALLPARRERGLYIERAARSHSTADRADRKYVAAPEAADIAANTVVTEHARELGQLRHRQQASVHQVLREYDLLGEVLEKFPRAHQRLPATPAADDASKQSPYRPAVRVLMQTTVATFLSEVHEHHYRTSRADRAVQSGVPAMNCALCSARRSSASAVLTNGSCARRDPSRSDLGDVSTQHRARDADPAHASRSCRARNPDRRYADRADRRPQ